MLAIVLKRKDWREYDQIITLYTREKGKIKALARGIKKSTSKNSSSLEPMSVVETEIVRGKELGQVTKVEIKKLFPKLRTNLGCLVYGCYAVDLFDTVITESTTEPELFELLYGWLNLLEDASDFKSILLPAFVIKTWAHLGLVPVLDRCLVCSLPISSKTKYLFDVSGGGVVEAACASKDPESSKRMFPINLAIIKQLDCLVYGSWSEIEKLALTAVEEKALNTLVFLFVSYNGTHKIKDWRKLNLANFS